MFATDEIQKNIRLLQGSGFMGTQFSPAAQEKLLLEIETVAARIDESIQAGTDYRHQNFPLVYNGNFDEGKDTVDFEFLFAWHQATGLHIRQISGRLNDQFALQQPLAGTSRPWHAGLFYEKLCKARIDYGLDLALHSNSPLITAIAQAKSKIRLLGFGEKNLDNGAKDGTLTHDLEGKAASLPTSAGSLPQVHCFRIRTTGYYQNKQDKVVYSLCFLCNPGPALLRLHSIEAEYKGLKRLFLFNEKAGIVYTPVTIYQSMKNELAGLHFQKIRAHAPENQTSNGIWKK